MLKVPQLDDITYEQLVQRAINKIPTMTNQWTDFNYHDPGVTVLQTYAWLVDMLNYYMNATGDVHILKYLKLLGVDLVKAKEAETHLMVKDANQHVYIPCGSKVYSGEICFEFQDTYDYDSNAFIAYLNEVDGVTLDLTAFTGEDNEYADMFGQEFRDQAVAYFGFENPLNMSSVVYFKMKERSQRQKFDENFSFSNLQWQYYGTDGWKDIIEIVDGTGGFLKSGLITFKLDGKMVAFNHPDRDVFATKPCYYLRCILKENKYDMLPRLEKVYTDPMYIKQQDRIASIEEFVYDGSDTLYSTQCVQNNDYLLVGIEKDGRFQVGFEFEGSEFDLCSLHSEDSLRPYISFVGYEPLEVGTKVQLVRLREDFLIDMKIGRTNGCCNQKLSFTYNQMDKISHIGISLWKELKEGGYAYERWNYVEDLEQSDYKARVFTYDKENETIIFGDGIHGVVPEQGMQVYVTELVLSKFGDGNVMPEEINVFANDSLPYTVFNPESAFNGKNEASIAEMLESLKDVLFTQNRMVSVQDYINMVKATPGLMIEEVQVIDGKRYGEIHHSKKEEQTVYLVVKQMSDQQRPALSENYKKLILEYLEPFRLINTKVVLASPNYVGVEVYGKIRLHNESEKAEILSFIKEQIVGDDSKTEFGKQILLGKMFTKLEIFESVKKIESLSLERVGSGAVKNSRGDIILYEDAIPYIRSVEIEFV